MGFRCGIVGLPNVGKSTVFNALTRAKVNAANYPFCTIDPNVGVISVADQRLKRIANIIKPKQILPAVVEFVDIAGLVKGASQGEGLGNKFLANIRETQAIAHVVRCFDNDNVIHVNGKVDPRADVEIINTELILADLETVERAINHLGKVTKGGNKNPTLEIELLEKLRNHLNQGRLAKELDITKEALPYIKSLSLLTTKPVLYVANVGEGSEKIANNNAYLRELELVAQREKAAMIPICATIETEIAELDEKDRKEFLAELDNAESGLDRVVQVGYSLLGLQTYFTAGTQEVRAWTINKNTKAAKAAGVIHGDFERGFICAEVISYDDYIKYLGEQGAKENGKLRLEGKEYVMEDGDVVHFRFNV